MANLHIANVWINGLLQAFKRLGLDVAALGRGIEAISSDGHLAGQLDLVDARTLWHRAVIQNDDPLLGVKVGLLQNPRSAGMLVPIILHSPSVRVALEHMAQFQTLISESGSYRVQTVVVNDEVLLACEYVPVPCSVAIHPQQVLSVIAGTVAMIRLASGGGVDLAKLYVPPLLDIDAIARVLACPVESREGNITMLIPEHQLDETIVGRDEHLYQLNLRYAEGLQRTTRVGQFFLDQVKDLINGEAPAVMTIDHVAGALEMHKRVLQRNLSEQGTSFRTLKESVLKERALALLIGERLEVASTAERLGYSDASSFHRAFKAWFGDTPRHFMVHRCF